MEFFILVTWLVLSIAAAVYANNKGRSGGGIFLLSLFLSPLVGFLVAAAMEPHEKEIARAKGMKKCPDCAEFVQSDARICRFCRHEFPATATASGLLKVGKVYPKPRLPASGTAAVHKLRLHLDCAGHQGHDRRVKRAARIVPPCGYGK